MKKDIVTVDFAAGHSALRHFKDAVRDVWNLLKLGIDFPAVKQPALQAELRELTAPHLALLVYKRAKVSAMSGALEDERWFGELSDFVSRMLWPHIEASEALAGRSKNCVAELLDEIVASEQRSMTQLALADVMPRTSRFGTGWAA